MEHEMSLPRCRMADSKDSEVGGRRGAENQSRAAIWLHPSPRDFPSSSAGSPSDSSAAARHLSLQDVKRLLVASAADDNDKFGRVEFATFQNKPAITKRLLLLLPGLDPATFAARPDLFPNLARCFGAPRVVKGLSPVANSFAAAQELLIRPSTVPSPSTTSPSIPSPSIPPSSLPTSTDAATLQTTAAAVASRSLLPSASISTMTLATQTVVMTAMTSASGAGALLSEPGSNGLKKRAAHEAVLDTCQQEEEASKKLRFLEASENGAVAHPKTKQLTSSSLSSPARQVHDTAAVEECERFPNEEQQQQERQELSPSTKKPPPAGPVDAAAFLLSPSQLRENNFPLPLATSGFCVMSARTRVTSASAVNMTSEALAIETPAATATELELPEGFLITEPAAPGRHFHKMVAVDCEMCFTKEGLELTRVTLIGQLGQVLYDELVLPANPITDYNTKYSGITPQMMKGVKTTLQVAREKVMQIVTSETILVGHSVEADLSALKMVHLKVIDTSVLYQHPQERHWKPKLRVLACRILKRQIQNDDKRGHDSVEDARAALDLVKLKILHGPFFGQRWFCQNDNGKLSMGGLLEMMEKKKTKCVVVDHDRTLLRAVTNPATSAIVCSNAADVVRKLKAEACRDDGAFSFGHFSKLVSFYSKESRQPFESISTYVASVAAAMTCSSHSKSNQNKSFSMRENGEGPRTTLCALDEGDNIGNCFIDEEMEVVLREVDMDVGAVFDKALDGTLMVVATAHGNTTIVRRIREWKFKRLQWKMSGLQPWDEATDPVVQLIESQVELGLLFCAVKGQTMTKK